MKFQLTICTVLMLGALAGCAGVTTDVTTRGNLPETAQGVLTYRFARTPAQAKAAATSSYEAVLGEGLAKRGFAQGEAGAAQYLVSVAWASRPAEVSVSAGGDCPQECPPASRSLFSWFGRSYVHTLTLRFFALPDGTEVYRVSAVKRDREADAGQALPWLAAGALAKLPDAGAPQWRVKLREAGEVDERGAAAARAMPEVVSVKPVPQPQ